MKKILIAAALMLTGIMNYACAQPQEKKTDKPEKGVVIQMNGDLYLKNIADYNNTQEWKYKGEKPVVIDFYADWCGPCRKIAPLMKELAEEYKDQITIYKVNVDNEQQLATSLNIQSLPTILFVPMKGNPQIIIGLTDKATLKRAIDEVLLGKPAK